MSVSSKQPYNRHKITSLMLLDWDTFNMAFFSQSPAHFKAVRESQTKTQSTENFHVK